MTNEHINEAQRRAAELLHEMDETMPQGALVPKELYGEALAGWASVVKAIDKVSTTGNCGYCKQPIEAFPDGTDYCACTTKRPCRHQYFTRPLDKKCAACNVISPFIKAMGEHHG